MLPRDDRVVQLPGTHLLPLQEPERLAAVLLDALPAQVP